MESNQVPRVQRVATETPQFAISDVCRWREADLSRRRVTPIALRFVRLRASLTYDSGVIMPDATVLQNLLSGAVGALGATALTYFVQRRLSQEAKKEEESRVAYVHLSAVTRILAGIEITNLLLEPYKKIFLNDKLEEIKKHTGKDIDAGEFIAALIRVQLNNQDDDWFTSSENIVEQNFGILRELMRETFDFNLSPEQLSKLPRDTVLSYRQFVALCNELRRGVDILLNIAEGKTPRKNVKTIFDGEFLFTMFYTASQLRQQVVDLRDRLRIYGGIDKKEAERILVIFKGIIARRHLASTETKANVEVAMNYMDAKLKEEKSKKEKASSSPDAAQRNGST